ncbi:hypothetical protein BS50DRAFT_586786 [Corynespora cassiicola Philippines]|uniref:Secreted protein n=1 Tax=Corynespora cassiicola Philippines TaxID=1448308 RepID=A0A2T2NVR8_CORCC|nr:hypothetical protein BS50DRAFT_586786 [Corynespora cassiicola Philippines]
MVPGLSLASRVSLLALLSMRASPLAMRISHAPQSPRPPARHPYSGSKASISASFRTNSALFLGQFACVDLLESLTSGSSGTSPSTSVIGSTSIEESEEKVSDRMAWSGTLAASR